MDATFIVATFIHSLQRLSTCQNCVYSSCNNVFLGGWVCLRYMQHGTSCASGTESPREAVTQICRRTGRTLQETFLTSFHDWAPLRKLLHVAPCPPWRPRLLRARKHNTSFTGTPPHPIHHLCHKKAPATPWIQTGSLQ